MGYRGSKDGNHDAIADDFRALGCTVADLYRTGVKDWPDLAVGCSGRTELVEIKNPDTRYGQQGLTPSQTTFAQAWRGSPVWMVRTTADVVALVNSWRKRR